MSPWEALILAAGAAASIAGTIFGIWLGLQPLRDLANQMDALSSEISAFEQELRK